jgi:hypothetical protein
VNLGHHHLDIANGPRLRGEQLACMVHGMRTMEGEDTNLQMKANRPLAVSVRVIQVKGVSAYMVG